MRPALLFPLFADAATLPGIGPRLAKNIENLIGHHRVLDLLFHLPNGLVDRRFSPKIAQAPTGVIATIEVTVDKHFPSPKNRRAPYKIRCSDETGFLHLLFFHGRDDYLKRQFPEGERLVVSGRIERFGGDIQMPHPDYVVSLEEKAKLATIEPVYPLTQGITPKVLRKAMLAALEKLPELPEWQDPHLLKRHKWPTFSVAITLAHHPNNNDDLDPASPARQRIAYDELLANQLALLLVRARQRKRPGRAIKGDFRLRQKIIDSLPYQLTPAQSQALAEIYGDQADPSPMLRLLQGDVGSGKTVVAFLALLNVVESGLQGALMAPTEILARQHFEGLAPMAARVGVRLELLTARQKGKAREQLLADLASGAIDILVGTHALVSDVVVFNDLGLAIIDEQHRFGVHQRMELANKGLATDTLVMTATPIPRSLALTHYGDIDVSQIRGKPPGRKPVDTRVVAVERLPEVVEAVGRQLATGGRVYWVCPLVVESELIDLAAAEARFADLLAHFGDKVALVHGKLKPSEKDQAMAGFIAGDKQLLVATTVIEVGVNVPEATVMVIEQAERFGLAQLHQLRGRIGRGDKPGTCLLLYRGPLNEAAKARLQTMRDTDDGFIIAEADLKLRGAGDLLGTKQAGAPEFKVADLSVHDDLLVIARDDARLILSQDPELVGPRGASLRHLLYLFERDEGIRYLRSG